MKRTERPSLAARPGCQVSRVADPGQPQNDGGTRRWKNFRRGITVLAVIGCLASSGCSKPKLVLNEAAQHFVAARAALEAGDKAKALTELDAAIAAGPDVWMYYERGKLHAEEGRDDQAKADCTAGLALDAEHPDLLWLQGELKKPKGRRFKGKQAEPPMGSK